VYLECQGCGLRTHQSRGRRLNVSHAGIFLAITLGITSCAQVRPYVPPSEGHITVPAQKADESSIPPPARTTTYVPPPKPTVKPQTYSVVVNEVPVKELLLALARDTRQNIDIHPGLQGLVSLNAIDETLPAILERISKQVNLRYRIEGNTIIVSPDTPYMKTYRVNYVNMTRDTVSTIGVSGEISGRTPGAGTSTAGAPATGTPGAATSGSSTIVRSVSRNDFWEQLHDNIRAILSSSRSQALTAEDKAARTEAVKAAREERLLQAEAVARAGQAATSLFTTAFGGAQPSVAGEVRDEIIVNPASGTVSVLATERQHQLVQQHIDNISQAVQRQVLIEATIVEVSLSDAYQGGIDWSRLAVSGGITLQQALLGAFNSAGGTVGNAFTIGYQNPTSSVGNISATVKMLQAFGNTRVLSSPKLMALNNQTALLKVVDNVVYFEVQAQTNTTQGVATTTFNTTPKFVSVGVVMGVTPQIADDQRVSLTVRPTISRVVKFVQDPNPSLVVNGTRIVNDVPEVQVREMESVLQVGSGQTVILGGLMQDDIRFNREQVPVVGDMRDIGEAFRFRDERVAKSELVIFLRPTVISNPSLETDELKFFQRFLPQAERQQSERTAAP
jgi:MSHA biogenesis protein MshL